MEKQDLRKQTCVNGDRMNQPAPYGSLCLFWLLLLLLLLLLPLMCCGLRFNSIGMRLCLCTTIPFGFLWSLIVDLSAGLKAP